MSDAGNVSRSCARRNANSSSAATWATKAFVDATDTSKPARV